MCGCVKIDYLHLPAVSIYTANRCYSSHFVCVCMYLCGNTSESFSIVATKAEMKNPLYNCMCHPPVLSFLWSIYSYHINMTIFTNSLSHYKMQMTELPFFTLRIYRLLPPFQTFTSLTSLGSHPRLLVL